MIVLVSEILLVALALASTSALELALLVVRTGSSFSKVRYKGTNFLDLCLQTGHRGSFEEEP